MDCFDDVVLPFRVLLVVIIVTVTVIIFNLKPNKSENTISNNDSNIQYNVELPRYLY